SGTPETRRSFRGWRPAEVSARALEPLREVDLRHASIASEPTRDVDDERGGVIAGRDTDAGLPRVGVAAGEDLGVYGCVGLAVVLPSGDTRPYSWTAHGCPSTSSVSEVIRIHG